MAKKKFIISSIPLIIASFVSFFFSFGVLAGFFGTCLYHRIIKTGNRFKSVSINFGNWKFRVHHWMMGVLFLLIIAATGLMPILPKFFIGGTVGIITHDLLTEQEWWILRRK